MKSISYLVLAAIIFGAALTSCNENDDKSKEFTVSFNTGEGGSIVEPQKVKEGENARKPEDPARNGYDFVAWYKEVDLSNKWVFDTDVVTADITLHAKWDEDDSDENGKGGYFLLIKDNETISLNTYENRKIKEHKVFAVSENSIFTTDKKERVAILDIDKNLITLYEIQTSKEIKLSIPYGIRSICILLNEENLLIGGERSVETGVAMLVQYHLQSEQWHELEVPMEVSRWGKAIDDLVVNDSLLIAIDNVVYPKYILFYHLNSTDKLVLSHFKSLIPNGTYESIRQGRITSKYLGVSSQTVSGYSGVHEHIRIYNDLDLTSSFAISIKTQYNIYTINDFLLIGEKLFIAHKDNGLGVFEIKNSYFITGQHHSTEIYADKVNYRQFKDEEIIRLTLIPNETKIVLTIKNSLGKIRLEIIET